MATAIAAPLFSSPSGFSKVHTDEHLQYRPAKNLETFNSLLPPAVEFVEGSSTGTLAVPEGKYEPINATPKSSRVAEESLVSGKSRASPKSPVTESASPSSSRVASLFTRTIETTWPGSPSVGVGLYNNGNTCFLNSALQCLLHTPPLVRMLMAHTKQDPCLCKTGFCMACSMRTVLHDTFSRTRPFTPLPISKNLHYIAKHLRKGRQEDSHEFLRYAIDALQKSCLAGHPPKIDPKLAETTWVHKIFGGRLRSRVTCSVCGYNSDTFDSILDLSIDVFSIGSLRDALRKFTAIDHLKGQDKYKCEKCKKPVNAEKQFTIHDAPMVLTVHLKRFTPLGRKLTQPIKYDERLSLQPSMSEGQFGPTYSLYGVISHAGSGPNSGHYYAHIKSPNGTWHEANDESIDRCTRAPVGLRNAYILFYLRDRGQSLEAAVNGGASGSSLSTSGVTVTTPVVPNVLKRKVHASDDEKDAAKDGTAKGRFIGPLLPDQGKATQKAYTPPAVDPQAAFLKSKIDGLKKRQPPPAPLASPTLKNPLVDYDGDSSSDVGEPVSKPPSPKPSSPPHPPTSPLTPTASQTTAPPLSASVSSRSFYSTGASTASSSFIQEEKAKKRKSPDTGRDSSQDRDQRSSSSKASTSAIPNTLGSSSKARESTSALSMKSMNVDSDSSPAVSRPSTNGGNPYSRLTGRSSNLDRDGSQSSGSNADTLLFRPRKLQKQQYGKNKRRIIM